MGAARSLTRPSEGAEKGTDKQDRHGLRNYGRGGWKCWKTEAERCIDRLNSALPSRPPAQQKQWAAQHGRAEEQAGSGVIVLVGASSAERRKARYRGGTFLSRFTRSNSASFYSNARIIFSISHILTATTQRGAGVEGCISPPSTASSFPPGDAKVQAGNCVRVCM